MILRGADGMAEPGLAREASKRRVVTDIRALEQAEVAQQAARYLRCDSAVPAVKDQNVQCKHSGKKGDCALHGWPPDADDNS
jgi:hypothetical protein